MVQWNAEEKSEFGLPDELFRFIHVRPVYEEPTPENQGQQQPRERHFCSAVCLRDYFNESRYTPPRSPREQKAQAEVNAAQAQPGTVDGFGKPKVLGTAKVIPFRRQNSAMEEVGGGAVSQADGAGDDSGPVLA